MSFLGASDRLLALAALAAAWSACSDDAGSTGSSTAGAGGATSGPGPTTGAMTTTATSTSSSPTTGTAQGGGGSAEGGGGAAGCGPLPLIQDAPDTLSETGLYADILTDEIAVWAKEFQPKYELWSDAAEKRRWFYLPDCEQIDTTDMDVWQMPVGARLWKQFTRGGERIETRLIMRTGPGDSDFEFAAYQWSGQEAYRVPNGVQDPVGPNDIPAESLCSSCHKSSWRVLGLSAVQLTHNLPGETMATLSAAGLLTTPLPGGIVVPGNQVESDALGYLHANCSNCHNQDGVPSVDMYMKILQSDTTVVGTDTYTTAVDVLTTMFQCGGCDRIEPGDPANSAVHQRMNVRGGGQMPPFATEIVDTTGVAIVDAWINTL